MANVAGERRAEVMIQELVSEEPHDYVEIQE